MFNTKNIILTITVCSVLILTCSLNAFAQIEQTEDSLRTNSLERGSWALQFQISNDFTLRSFKGSVISIKRHLSSNIAIRFGASLTFTNNDNDEDEWSLRDDTMYSMRNHRLNYNAQTIELMPQFIYYLDPRAKINFYFGGGPLCKYQHYHSEQDYNEYTNTRHYLTRDWYWSIGVGGFVGAEWFPMKIISFHAEYGTTVSYFWGNNKSTSQAEDVYLTEIYSEESEEGWNLSASSVLFGLSIYF